MQSNEIRPSSLLAGLSVEVALYGVIGAAARSVRLIGLGRWPLQADEATTALAAWRALHSAGADPFVRAPAALQRELAALRLTSASDATLRCCRRWWGLPWPWRPIGRGTLLGRVGALATALLLCLAPTWVTFSRTAASPILTAAVGAVLLAGVWHVLRGGIARAVRLLAIGLGLGPVARAGFYTALLAVALFGVLWWHAADETTRQHLRRVWAGPTLRQNLLLAGGLLLFSSSGLLLNWAGVGMTVQEAARWLSQLWPYAGAAPFWQYGRLLLGYEVLTLALAAVALARAWRLRQAIDGLLALWVGWRCCWAPPGGHRGRSGLPMLCCPWWCWPGAARSGCGTNIPNTGRIRTGRNGFWPGDGLDFLPGVAGYAAVAGWLICGWGSCVWPWLSSAWWAMAVGPVARPHGGWRWWCWQCR
jgi:hypothetical protein